MSQVGEMCSLCGKQYVAEHECGGESREEFEWDRFGTAGPTNCLCACPKEPYCPFHKKELRVKTATEILRNRYGITEERIAEARAEAANETEPAATEITASENTHKDSACTGCSRLASRVEELEKVMREFSQAFEAWAEMRSSSTALWLQETNRRTKLVLESADVKEK